MTVKRVLVAEIGRPHGLHGLVRLRSFTVEREALERYTPLTDATGTHHFHLTLKGKDLAAIAGVSDRDSAARLTGTKLYVARDRLPPPAEDEYYLVDLIGLRAVTESGEEMGQICAVEDYGGGPFLVVVAGNHEQLLPFTRRVVPVVDLAAGRVVVAPPAELMIAPPRRGAQRQGGKTRREEEEAAA